MYFTPLASGGGSATYFLFLEVSAEALRLFFETFPHWDLFRIRVIDLLIFVDFLQVKISLSPIFFSFFYFS